MDLKEQEKFLEIKKEVIKVIESKQEKIKKNNIKIDIMVDIMNDEENYYIHYNEHNCFRYDWYDEEYHTVFEIAEQLNIMLDRFLKERENVSISTNKLLS